MLAEMANSSYKNKHNPYDEDELYKIDRFAYEDESY